MNDAQLAGLALLALIAITIWDLIKAYRNGGIPKVKYALKGLIDGFKPMVYLIFAMFGLIGMITITPAIVEWADKQTASSPLAYLLLNKGTSLVWFIFVLYAVFRIVRAGYKPVFKYSDQEKQWKRESQEKFRAKLPKVLQRFVKIDK